MWEMKPEKRCGGGNSGEKKETRAEWGHRAAVKTLSSPSEKEISSLGPSKESGASLFLNCLIVIKYS